MSGALGDVGEVPVTEVKRLRKDWRMSCDVSAATEGLASEALLILQPFRRRFTYVTDTSPTSSGEPPIQDLEVCNCNFRISCIKTSYRALILTPN